MSKRIEVKSGDRYNDLTVIKEVSKIGDKRAMECVCKCGEIEIVKLGELTRGRKICCVKCTNKNRKIQVKPGQVFGSWTVIKEAEPHITKSGIKMRMFHCRCECGTEKDVALDSLTRGKSKQCRECRKTEIKPNQVFGRWTVLYETNACKGKGGRNDRMFHCRCECGTEKDIMLSSLTTGQTTQCHKCSARTEIKPNQVFGRWTVLYETELRGIRKTRSFHCRCECGIERDVLLHSLISGRSKGCQKCGRKERDRKYRISKGLDPDTYISPRTEMERKVFASTIRTKIFSRDNGKCQMCFKPAEAVHHIIPWALCDRLEDQQLRYDPENCISLCRECHLEAHNGQTNSPDIDNWVAEQLITKAIENTEKNHKHMKGMKEEALKKVEEIS